MLIQICIGSSCHIKGSHEIVELMKDSIEKYGLNDEIVISGSFCTGKCNRVGVTITIDEVIHTGVTKENFKEFFEQNIVQALKAEG